MQELKQNGDSDRVSTRELTAFVREVVLPGSCDTVPKINPRSCSFKLRYGESPIHRWGIFAAESIPARRRVIEYTGQKIDAREVWRRRFRYHLYIFWINRRWALDGAIGGSGAEFINHSCDPNLSALLRGGHIFLCSLRQIALGEELTLNYDLADDGLAVPCLCGSEKCRGFMSVRSGETLSRRTRH